jgi:hypothetical protein
MAQGFLAVVSGKIKQVFAIVTSAGAGDAGKVPALDASGKLDASFMPTGIGANTVVVPTSENLSAGDFVNLYSAAGTLTARKADNSNNREAWGYVTASVTSPANATVQRLNTVNASRTGLTAGAEYWLGVAGGVISTPLDPVADVGKTSQYLGIAKSATELATTEYQAVQL